MGEQQVEQRERASTPPVPQFRSILFDGGEVDVARAQQPAFFGDLNLDQVVAAITRRRDEYDLTGFFYMPLRTVAAVEYRHEVFCDFDDEAVQATVRRFAERMQSVRRRLGLAKKQHYRYEKQRWFLDAADVYCEAVSTLGHELDGLNPASRALQRLRDYVAGYTASEGFTTLASETSGVLEALAQVKYTLRIKGKRVTVSEYNDERDYSVEVERTFERFRQGQVEAHTFRLTDSGSMDHIEARIAELVARLYPEPFRALDAFCSTHRAFLDATITRFDREVQFYLAYLEHRDRLTSAGLPFVTRKCRIARKRSQPRRRSTSHSGPSSSPKNRASSPTTSSSANRSACS
jgi:DNA mismatch repair protein MutS